MSNPNENAVAVQPAETKLAKASPKATFQQLVDSDKFKSQIMMALPKHLTPERFIRVLMTATLKTPKLLECTQESMFNSIFTAAAAGVEIDGRRAALVPLTNRKKQGNPLEANLWLMYQGIAELVMRSGLVSNIHADLVCDADEFEYDRGELKKHKIDYRKDRGNPYAVYSIIRMKDGSEKVEVLSFAEVERIRKASPGADGDAWRNSWGEMAKKTAFRRASKWVPLSAEVKNALEAEPEPEPVNVTPKPTLAALIGAPVTQEADIIGAQQAPVAPPPAASTPPVGTQTPPAAQEPPKVSERVPSELHVQSYTAEQRLALLTECEEAMMANSVTESRVLKYATEHGLRKPEQDELCALSTQALDFLRAIIPTLKK